MKSGYTAGCFAVMMVLVAHSAKGMRVCPSNTQTGDTELKFAGNMSGRVRQCRKEKIGMECCIIGNTTQTTIQWEFSQGNKWVPFLHDQSSPSPFPRKETREEDQVAVIDNVEREDHGVYRCTVSNRQTNLQIQRNITLEVYECYSGVAGAPVITQPHKATYKRKYGENVEIVCEGQFGDVPKCESCYVDWFKIDPNLSPVLNESDTSRVHIKRYTSYESNIGTNLSIRNIEKSDFGRYKCNLANTYNTSAAIITLEYGDEENNTPSYMWPLLITFSVIFATVLVVSVVTFANRHTIQLYWKDNFKRKKSDKEYHFFILYEDRNSTRDHSFVWNHLIPELKTKLNYNICLIEEDPECFGKSDFSLYDHASSRSQCLVAVLSADFLQNEVLKACLHDACIDNYRNLIFITYTDSSLVMNQFQTNDPIQVAYRIAHKVIWPESERQRKKFWTRLRQKLPPIPRPTTEQCERSSPVLNARIPSETSEPLLGPDTLSVSNGCQTITPQFPNTEVGGFRQDNNLENEVFNNADANFPSFKTLMSKDSGRGFSISGSP